MNGGEKGACAAVQAFTICFCPKRGGQVWTPIISFYLQWLGVSTPYHLRYGQGVDRRRHRSLTSARELDGERHSSQKGPMAPIGAGVLGRGRSAASGSGLTTTPDQQPRPLRQSIETFKHARISWFLFCQRRPGSGRHVWTASSQSRLCW